MGQPIEHGGRHFGVAEHLRPIGEGEIGGDQQRSVLIELADQVEEQLAELCGKVGDDDVRKAA